MVMVADFQIANREQKTFLKEIPLTPLLYEFLHGREYSIQISKREMSHLKTHEKPSLVIILAEFCHWKIKMKHDEKVMSVIRPSTTSMYSFTSTPVTKTIDGVPKVSKTKKFLTKTASDQFCLLTKRNIFPNQIFCGNSNLHD